MPLTPGSRALLLKHRPRRVESVQMPDDYPDAEIAGSLWFVQALTADEKADFDNLFLTKKGQLIPRRAKQLRLRLVIATVVDATGTPLFGESDLVALGQVDTGLIDALVTKAQALNSYTDADLAAAEKNCAPTTAGG